VRRRRSAPKQTNPAGGGGSWCRFTATAVGDEGAADLGVVPIENSESVFVNGLLTVAYSLAGSVVTFDYALSADDIVTIFYQSATSCGVGELTAAGPMLGFVYCYQGFDFTDITSDVTDSSDATYRSVDDGIGADLPFEVLASASPVGLIEVTVRLRGSGVTVDYYDFDGDVTLTMLGSLGTLTGSFADYTFTMTPGNIAGQFFISGDATYDIANISVLAP
jgi:hypothetical protein